MPGPAWYSPWVARGLAPQPYGFMFPGGPDQGHQVVPQGVFHVDPAADFPNPHQFRPGHDRGQFIQGVASFKSQDDGIFLLGRRIALPDFKEKPVQLGFRQREGPGLFHRILGGQDQKRSRQGPGFPIHRHLPFLHGFQEAGLGPGGWPG